MKNKELKLIYFPHVIFGNVLGGREHTFNDIHGGIKPLSDFNINQHNFLGGNCTKEIGLIDSYGFYACPYVFDTKKIVAFYIHDPEQITDLGKQLIEEYYPDYQIVYERMSTSVHKVLTAEEIAKKRDLLQKIADEGINPKMVEKSTVEELDGLLQAVESGKSNLEVKQEQLKAASAESKPQVQKLKKPPSKG